MNAGCTVGRRRRGESSEEEEKRELKLTEHDSSVVCVGFI